VANELFSGSVAGSVHGRGSSRQTSLEHCHDLLPSEEQIYNVTARRLSLSRKEFQYPLGLCRRSAAVEIYTSVLLYLTVNMVSLFHPVLGR